jgi:hypothetical protein
LADDLVEARRAQPCREGRAAREALLRRIGEEVVGYATTLRVSRSRSAEGATGGENRNPCP